jgi:hypothetical protein
MGDTDKMCVYEGYNKARDCRVDTLVKHEVHRYLSTSEWINAAYRQQKLLCRNSQVCPWLWLVKFNFIINIFSLLSFETFSR